MQKNAIIAALPSASIKVNFKFETLNTLAILAIFSQFLTHCVVKMVLQRTKQHNITYIILPSFPFYSFSVVYQMWDCKKHILLLLYIYTPYIPKPNRYLTLYYTKKQPHMLNGSESQNKMQWKYEDFWFFLLKKKSAFQQIQIQLILIQNMTK